MMIKDGLLTLEEHDYNKIEEELKAGKKLIKTVKAELKEQGYQIFEVQRMIISREPKYVKLSTKISKALRKEVLKSIPNQLNRNH